MRLFGLIITLAAIGYAIHLYLGSSGGTETAQEQQIDQAKQATEAMNQALQSQQQKLDGAN